MLFYFLLLCFCVPFIYLDLMICLILLMISYEQRDTNGLSSENSELKLSLHTMEQQCNLQDGGLLFKTFL